MRGQECFKWSNISSTAAPSSPPSSVKGTAFFCNGGYYRLDAVATTFGTVTLQALGPDGATYLTQLTVSANGSQFVYLAPGLYQLTVSGTTALYVNLTRVPGD